MYACMLSVLSMIDVFHMHYSYWILTASQLHVKIVMISYIVAMPYHDTG